MAEKIYLHLSGPDKPGLTYGLLSTIKSTESTLWDFGQSLINGYLNLSALVEPSKNSKLVEKALYFASANGLKMEAQPLEQVSPEKDTHGEKSFCVTLVGDLSNVKALSDCTQKLADLKANITEIKTLSKDSLNGVEFIARASKSTNLLKLREELYKISSNVDIAIQDNNWFRHARRLVCLDVDSTFIEAEAIDELAELCGKKSEVSKITEAAMQGKLNFDDAFKQRVKCLKGLDKDKAATHLAGSKCTQGAEDFVCRLQKLGFKVGLLSGGFDFFVNSLQDKFNLDFAHANCLEVDSENKFTGNVKGEILGPKAKANWLKKMCDHYGFQKEHSIAIGDGANDLLMLENAGLGIAYRAKAKLKEKANMSMEKGAFSDLFYLMGIHKAQWE